jgi:hypothetical protein
MIEIDVSKSSLIEIQELCSICNGELNVSLEIVRIEGGLDV